LKYGDFSEDLREYVITRPDTPTPWINYISNMRGYCGIVSQTGGGFSFHQDPRDRRITKYRYNNIPVDRPGRYIYVRDDDTGEYWSPSWQPVMKKPDSYRCRHGLGYTIISSEYSGISHELTYFVPVDYDCEVWRLKIRNDSGRKRSFSLIPYSEFTMWCEPESRNIQWSLHLTRCGAERGMVFYDFVEPHPAFDMNANKNYRADRPGFAYMGINMKVLDFDCSRDAFIGMYNSETNPDGAKRGKLSNSIIRGGIACAALRASFELAPGKEKELVVTLGFSEKREEARQTARFFSGKGAVDAGLKKVKKEWDKFLGAMSFETPDRELNTMANVWNQYQCKTTFDWSRYISFYENGEGRGMGTRDSCQDTLAVNAMIPGRVKDRIRQIISTCQFETGDCYHQFFPLGGRGDLKGFSDDHLWLVVMVHAYLAETGDFKMLKERLKYADSEREDDIYTHLKSAVDYTERMKGPNGLPLILTADWNDTLHLWMEAKEPESVLTAQFYIYTLSLLADIAVKADKSADAEIFKKRAADMARLVNEKCWDGGWYLRGFGAGVIGTYRSKQAKIFLNTQSWAVISGAAPPDRARKAMESVSCMLAGEEGIKTLWPPFSSYDQAYGLISRYNVGRKENGIFSHANAWAIIAEALLERPEKAFEYYKNILPLKRNNKAEILKTEPYVFCQTICTEEAHNAGEGANSWLTGTASWMHVAATRYILGIRPVLGGLKIAPVIPKEWPGFTAKRRFRGCEYTIRVKRGLKRRIRVNGREIDGDVIKPGKGKRAEVDVEI